MLETQTSPLIPKWTNDLDPIYDINKTYLENFEEGPFFQGLIPCRKFNNQSEWLDFLGHKVMSPLGVPAGPLLSSKWISLASKLGFDILTYKTIRSKKHKAHPLPNMLYVDPINEKNHSFQKAISRKTPHENINNLSVTNSFGMPSMSKNFLLEDIGKANNCLLPGQLLVVSIVGTSSPGIDLFQDFVEAAALAKDAGAKVIEANFSCPNVNSKEGSLYKDPDAVYRLGKKLKEALGSTPLIIKVGYLESDNEIEKLALAAAKANIDAISGINTISASVNTPEGNPALSDLRKNSGICGGPIRDYGVQFIKKLSNLIKTHQLHLPLIGVGGITLPEDFDKYLSAGATVSQSATGMMWDPYLAMRYHQKGD